MELAGLLEAENKARCVPPLDAYELAIIVRQATTQPDRPDFTPPLPERPLEYMAPLNELKMRPELGDVAAAIALAVRSIKKHVPGALERQVAQQTMVGRLEDVHVETRHALGANRLH